MPVAAATARLARREGDEEAAGVADDHAGRRRGVVVVHQLEEEAEAAAVAADGRGVGQALAPVVVDRTVLAVRADEVRHGPYLFWAASDCSRWCSAAKKRSAS